MTTSKTELWTQQIQKITEELENLLMHRQIYRHYGEIVNSNKSIGSEGAIFHNWIKTNYVTFVSMSIRRQMDMGADVVSLVKLINAIRQNPAEITRDWYRSLYTNEPLTGNGIAAGMADQFFNETAGNGDTFDPAIAQRDLATLTEIGKDVKLLATRTIAHNIDEEVPKLTFDQADQCIDKFREITSKYILLLTAAGNDLEPVIADDWQNVFTKVWITPS